VVSAGATREAVALNLGLSHGSGRPHAETTVELLHRIVLAPLTAKHLHQLLGRLIDEHDAQRGALR
ncbi:MAG: hypothetical protein ACREVC_16225, partial [Burkholderiales bacterium]